MKNRLAYAKTIVRFASIYNASALIFFLVPGALSLLNVAEPYSSFWRVLPALLASYAALVLWLSSSNVVKYASFPFWNGIIRIVFAIVALFANYQLSVGSFILWLAVGDLLIGSLCLYFIKVATRKTIIDLIINK